MSKAFTKEDDVDEREPPLPPRPRDPNPITARGLRALQARFAAFDHQNAREARIVKSVLDTVRVKPANVDEGFGCAIAVVDVDSGDAAVWEVVGPDEADPAARRVSLVSPLGRALSGKRAGDVVVVRRPAGEQELRIVSVTPLSDEAADRRGER